MTQKKWNQIQEKGNVFLLSLMLQIYQLGGKYFFRFSLFIVIFWYWLFAPIARKSSLEYLTNLHQYYGKNSPFKTTPHLGHVYLHLYSFGSTILERLVGWLGQIKEDKLKIYGHSYFTDNYDKGMLIVINHFGNLEILQALKGTKKTINVLVYTKHAESYNEVIQKYSTGHGHKIKFLQIDDFDVSSAFMLQQKIDDGEWLIVAADRVPISSNRMMEFDFLGKPSDWPMGGWILANLLKCPLVTLFCYNNQQYYEVHIGELYREELVFNRKNRDVVLRELIEQYVRLVESHCQKKPYLWFNFFPFWKKIAVNNNNYMENNPDEDRNNH